MLLFLLILGLKFLLLVFVFDLGEGIKEMTRFSCGWFEFLLQLRVRIRLPKRKLGPFGLFGQLARVGMVLMFLEIRVSFFSFLGRLSCGLEINWEL